MVNPEFVVDTCVIVASIKGNAAAGQWLTSNQSRILLPSIVYLELFMPATMNAVMRRHMTNVTSGFRRVNPNPQDWAIARNTLRDWNPQHTRPDIPDLIIGVTAASLGLKVATLNIKDFENIPGCTPITPF